MDIVVYGAGSLGSLIGGLLARRHDVTLVGRADHVRTIQHRGLTIEGVFDETVTPRATTDGRDLEADLALVTVKAYDTDTAGADLATGTYDAVCSLQNGMGNEETLACHLECPVLAGTVTYGALSQQPGVVACTGIGDVTLGDRTGGYSPLAERAVSALRDAGIEATHSTAMPLEGWKKLAVNAGINPITALADRTNGAVLEEPLRTESRAATRETARVARADGVRLSNREALAALEAVATATAANRSSMCADVRADRRTEIDAISGYVCEQGAALGVETPVNRTLRALVAGRTRG